MSGAGDQYPNPSAHALKTHPSRNTSDKSVFLADTLVTNAHCLKSGKVGNLRHPQGHGIRSGCYPEFGMTFPRSADHSD
jgi:hypothetical protein